MASLLYVDGLTVSFDGTPVSPHVSAAMQPGPGETDMAAYVRARSSKYEAVASMSATT